MHSVCCAVKNRFDNAEWIVAAILVFKLVVAIFCSRVVVNYLNVPDADFYMNQGYVGDSSGRTVFVQNIASNIFGIFGRDATFATFSVISALPLCIYILRGGDPLAILALFFPSAAIWTGFVGKEALFYAAYSAVLVSWALILNQGPNRWNVVIGVLGVVFGLFFRPHYMGPALLLISSSVVLIRFPRSVRLPCIGLMWAVMVLAITLSWGQLLERGFFGVSELGNTSRFVELGLEPQTDRGLADFADAVGLGALWGFTGFSLSEIGGSIIRKIVFFEGVVILLSPLVCFLMRRRLPSASLPHLYYALLPALLFTIIIHAPFGVMNAGTAVRWRTNFELLFYLAPLFLFLRTRRS